MHKKIDVIIPLHNDEAFIRYAVKSVLMQTYPAQKIIVVNDRSTDNSIDIIRQMQSEDSRIILLDNAGVERSAARNTGIKISTAEYVAFLDSDDVWYPTKIEKQVNLLGANSEVGVVYSNYLMIGPKGEFLYDKFCIPANLKGIIFNELLAGNFISGSASGVVCKRNLFNLTGYFDEKLSFSEDWDMWLRLSSVAKFDFISDPVVFIRAKSQSHFQRPSFKKRLYQEKTRLIVWSKWPNQVCEDHAVLSEIRGYFLNTVLKENLSLHSRYLRLKVIENILKNSLNIKIYKKLAKNHKYLTKISISLEILREHFYQELIHIRRKVRNFLSHIKQSILYKLTKLKIYLAKKYKWLGPLKRKIYSFFKTEVNL